MKPSHATLEIHREVFGFDGQSDARLPPVSGAGRSRQPIRRAVEEAAATDGYVPLSKKPVDWGQARVTLRLLLPQNNGDGVMSWTKCFFSLHSEEYKAVVKDDEGYSF